MPLSGTSGPTAVDVAAPVYPPASLPTLFVDGALNFNHSPQVVKFYFFRFDPSLTGGGTALPQAVAQVVMPCLLWFTLRPF
jgi:hypothetical protein